MKVPRFRIAWGMVFVAIVALNFGAIRASFGFEPYVAQALRPGALPMANVLAGGIRIGSTASGKPEFLLGIATHAPIPS